MAVTYGYARCSLTEDKGGQDIKRQTNELKAAGAKIVIEEREHGDKEKEKLTELLNHMEPQSSLVVCEVSRLARSTKMLCEIIDIIKAKKLRLIILGSVTIDCRSGEIDPMSQAFLQMAGIFSELELSMIRARVRSGMQNAKAKGKQIGRKPTTKEDIPQVFMKHYPALENGSINITEMARLCGLSRPTIYKYMRMIG